MKIFCVIPAYNEEETIVSVIKSVKPLVDELVVVDDGSTDKTFELAKAQEVTVLRHAINRGQGAALQTGNDYALKNNADIIAHFDADGQFAAEEIACLTEPIRFGRADIVFGSRFLGKATNLPALKKLIILPLAGLVNRLLFRARLSDPQCGFRALSAGAAKKIKIKNDGMAHCSEIIGQAFQKNLRIAEAPVAIVYREYGQRFSGAWRILKDLLISRIIG